MATDAHVERFFEVVKSKGIYPNVGNLRFGLNYSFEGVAFSGKRMLDIGAGVGLLGLYGKCMGAARVVCLEPEDAGATTGVRQRFDDLVSALMVEDVIMMGETFQQFDPGKDRFDIIVMHNSVNHLDEDACMRLHWDEDARATYHRLFAKLYAIAAPEAHLIVADCSRYNLFGSIGLRCPFAPSIEWNKHQPPRLWARMLCDAGFSRPRIRWTTFNTLRGVGRMILGNRVAAFLTHSLFCLTVRR